MSRTAKAAALQQAAQLARDLGILDAQMTETITSWGALLGESPSGRRFVTGTLLEPDVDVSLIVARHNSDKGAGANTWFVSVDFERQMERIAP